MPSESDMETERRSTDAAAETTHFRHHLRPEAANGPDEEKRQSDVLFTASKSMRLTPRPGRGSLAMKVVLPLILVLIGASTIAGFIFYSRIGDLQIAELKEDASSAAFFFGVYAQRLFIQREKFNARHPDFATATEWRSGEYWVTDQGFVRPEDWVKATGFGPNEFAPVPVLEDAARQLILSRLALLMNSSDLTAEIVGAIFLNPDGSYLASAFNQSLKIDPSALKMVPHPEEYIRLGNFRITVDYVNPSSSLPLVRGLARVYSSDDQDRLLGSAVVLFRNWRHREQLRSFQVLILGLLSFLAVFMALAGWLATKRITRPLRRLAADMQAMAEGDYARRATSVSNDEIGMLAMAFNSMAERLRVARANEKENSRLESDLAIARGIQNNLLPMQTPRVRGLDIYTTYRPAKEIGGDYFDFLPVDNQHMGVVIADASGKSIPAALVMSTTRAILRFVAPGCNSAAETLTKVNAILSVDIPKGMFVTAYYLILDPLNNSMLCASAGHTPLLIARGDGSVELMNPGGIALGFAGGPVLQRAIRVLGVRLEKGDRVLLYTDGVVEAVNPANEEYSDRRLREFLRRNRELSSHDFVGALLADLDRHRGTAAMRDDTTIVTFRVM